MAEKVKVSREVAEAIEYLLNHEHYGYTKEKLLLTHAEMERFPKRTWANNSPLNDVELLDLAAILVNDYEVEKTPEEKVKDFFVETSQNARQKQCIFEDRTYYDGLQQGVFTTLEMLNIKIIGVNAVENSNR